MKNELILMAGGLDNAWIFSSMIPSSRYRRGVLVDPAW